MFRDTIDEATDLAARAEAKRLGAASIRFSHFMYATAEEFDDIGVIGLPAARGLTFEQLCPDLEDRFRILCNVFTDKSPVILLYDGPYTLLDGYHRAVAAYLSGISVYAAIYVPIFFEKIESGAEE